MKTLEHSIEIDAPANATWGTVIDGGNSAGNALASTQPYDRITQSWTADANMNGVPPRACSHAAARWP